MTSFKGVGNYALHFRNISVSIIRLIASSVCIGNSMQTGTINGWNVLFRTAYIHEYKYELLPDKTSFTYLLTHLLQNRKALILN